MNGEALSISSQEAADLALKHRLYVSGWCLSGALQRIRAGNGEAVIVQVNNKYVAVAAYEDGVLQVFTRKSERRKGYGTLAVKTLVDKTGIEDYSVLQGIYTAELFWESIK